MKPTLEQAKTKGTVIPFIPKGIKYRCDTWGDDDHMSNAHPAEGWKKNMISHGTKMFKGEEFLLIDEPNYKGKCFYMFRISDLIAHGVIEDFTPKTFSVTGKSSLLKAFLEDLQETGYVIHNDCSKEFSEIKKIETNLSCVYKHSKIEEFKQIYINAHTIKELQFSLPQQYCEALEHAKKCLDVSCWKEQYSVGDLVWATNCGSNGLPVGKESVVEIVDNSFSARASGLTYDYDFIVKYDGTFGYYYRVNSETAKFRKLTDEEKEKYSNKIINVNGVNITIGINKIVADGHQISINSLLQLMNSYNLNVGMYWGVYFKEATIGCKDGWTRDMIIKIIKEYETFNKIKNNEPII